jgi:hypothetical protein
MEFARQYVQDNNGRLLASSKHLSKRGWKSADVIQRAKRELIEGGFIYETVKGHRPNKASWYAITWQNLDKHAGYDAGTWEGWKSARSGYSQIKEVIPSKGVVGKGIAPSGGVVMPQSIPSGRTIVNTFNCGNHLDIPSTQGIISAIPS